MPSSYSTRLRFELIGVGEFGVSGNWGTTTNVNLGTLIEEAIAGIAPVPVTDGAATVLSTIDGGTDQARQMIINLTGALTAQREVRCPAVQKLYFVRNATSGGHGILFKTASGTGIVIPNGKIRAVYCDGTNVNDLITDLPATTQLNGVDITTISGTQTLTNKTLNSPRVDTAILDTNGNEAIRVAATASAVNEIQISNAATSGTPAISATGNDANIGINLVGKGTGQIFANSLPVVTTTGTQTLTNKTLTSPVISSISNTGTITIPTATTTLVGRDTTDTLTNKTLTTPAISSISNSGTITLPTGNHTLVGRDTTDTLTNKTLTAPTISTISNSGTITLPTGNRTLVALDTADTLTNKTLTSPVISSISNSGTITLPTGNHTLVGRDTTDTLTNKTLTAPAISTISNSGTITLPTGTRTLVARDTTDTLTNKTLTLPAISSISNGGTVTIPSGTLTLLGDNSLANQATMETGTSTSAIVTPGVQRYHPGHPKAWSRITVTGGVWSLSANYGVSSITAVTSFEVRHSFATSFSSAFYTMNAIGQRDSVNNSLFTAIRVAGSFTPNGTTAEHAFTSDGAGALTPAICCATFSGDQ